LICARYFGVFTYYPENSDFLFFLLNFYFIGGLLSSLVPNMAIFIYYDNICKRRTARIVSRGLCQQSVKRLEPLFLGHLPLLNSLCLSLLLHSFVKSYLSLSILCLYFRLFLELPFYVPVFGCSHVFWCQSPTQMVCFPSFFAVSACPLHTQHTHKLLLLFTLIRPPFCSGHSL